MPTYLSRTEHYDPAESFTEHDEHHIELTNLPVAVDHKQDQQDPVEEDEAAKNYSTAKLTFAFVEDWTASIVIGFLVVCYWRGSWVLLDLYTCKQPQSASLVAGDSFCFGVEYTNPTRVKSAWVTYLVGNFLLVIGVLMMRARLWIPVIKTGSKTQLRVTKPRAALRSLMVYVLGAATVNIWRGIWYLTDYLILPNAPLASWWLTAGCGMGGAFLIYAGPSLLAPPAIFNMDGPGVNPPPLAVTIVSSYFSIAFDVSHEAPQASTIANSLDILSSFLILPVFVVWFWRGVWLLLDRYLWGLTAEVQDVYNSIGYGTAMAFFCLFLGSDDVVYYIPTHSKRLNQAAGRIRTFVLAIGTVSFWRVVWLLWDEFCGGTSYWSAWLSHVLGVCGLLFLGCLSCIAAPPTTLGVDAVAAEDCADEPLFQDIPIPAETIFVFGIGRQPLTIAEATDDVQGRRQAFASLGRDQVARRDVMSSTRNLLSSRNATKRLNNQFFRSR